MIQAIVLLAGLTVIGFLIFRAYRDGKRAGGDAVSAATNATTAETAARMAEAAAGLPVTRKDRAQRARESGL